MEAGSHSLLTALRKVPAFASIDDRTALMVVGTSVNLFWPTGALIFAKGAETEGLFIVLSGRVRVFDEVGGEKVEIAQVGPGDFFGELSLVLDSNATMSVEAIEDSDLMVLPKDSFRQLLGENPPLAIEVRRRLEDRAGVRPL